ncbi:hypothetical protein DFH06DRAFT_111387 [Mycena polygramma]|nr:hypothetical protein DFH06DRAFT_111387 [Mycena polygramma]
MPPTSFDPATVVESRTPHPRPRRVARPSMPVVKLFCGAPQPLTASDFDAHRPWSVQILPGDFSPPPAKRQKVHTPKSNGCGTMVHARVVPAHSGLGWRGLRKGVADVVVDLCDQYVPPELCARVKTRLEECGCLRGPVGCAICGNLLGVSFSRCKTHTHTDSPQLVWEFLPSAVSPPLPSQESLHSNTDLHSRTGDTDTSVIDVLSHLPPLRRQNENRIPAPPIVVLQPSRSALRAIPATTSSDAATARIHRVGTRRTRRTRNDTHHDGDLETWRAGREERLRRQARSLAGVEAAMEFDAEANTARFNALASGGWGVFI